MPHDQKNFRISFSPFQISAKSIRQLVHAQCSSIIIFFSSLNMSDKVCSALLLKLPVISGETGEVCKGRWLGHACVCSFAAGQPSFTPAPDSLAVELVWWVMKLQSVVGPGQNNSVTKQMWTKSYEPAGLRTIGDMIAEGAENLGIIHVVTGTRCPIEI